MLYELLIVTFRNVNVPLSSIYIHVITVTYFGFQNIGIIYYRHPLENVRHYIIDNSVKSVTINVFPLDFDYNRMRLRLTTFGRHPNLWVLYLLSTHN